MNTDGDWALMLLKEKHQEPWWRHGDIHLVYNAAGSGLFNGTKPLAKPISILMYDQ